MIELRGIIQYYHERHKYTQVVVTDGHPDIHVTLSMGVDVTVNKGQVLKFLGDHYDMEPGHIKWPHHIKAETI